MKLKCGEAEIENGMESTREPSHQQLMAAQLQLIDFQFKKYLKKDLIPKESRQDTQIKFRQLLSHLSSQNRKKNSYLTRKKTVLHQLIGSRPLQRCRSAVALSTPSAFDFRDIQQQILQEKYRFVDYSMIKKKLQTSCATLSAMNQQAILINNKKSEKQSQVYQLNRQLENQDRLTIFTVKQNEKQLSKFRLKCSVVLQQKRQFCQLNQSMKQSGRLNLAQRQISITKMRAKLEQSKKILQETEQQQRALKNRRAQSDTFKKMLELLEIQVDNCLNLQKIPEEEKVQIKSKAEKMGQWLTDCYDKKLGDISRCYQMYQLLTWQFEQSKKRLQLVRSKNKAERPVATVSEQFYFQPVSCTNQKQVQFLIEVTQAVGEIFGKVSSVLNRLSQSGHHYSTLLHHSIRSIDNLGLKENDKISKTELLMISEQQLGPRLGRYFASLAASDKLLVLTIEAGQLRQQLAAIKKQQAKVGMSGASIAQQLVAKLVAKSCSKLKKKIAKYFNEHQKILLHIRQFKHQFSQMQLSRLFQASKNQDFEAKMPKKVLAYSQTISKIESVESSSLQNKGSVIKTVKEQSRFTRQRLQKKSLQSIVNQIKRSDKQLFFKTAAEKIDFSRNEWESIRSRPKRLRPATSTLFKPLK